MDEILSIADVITVMRDGKYIGSYPAAELNNQQLINLIVGRGAGYFFEKRSSQPGKPLLTVNGLSGEKFSAISFDVKQGEILGIAGLMGAGRTEIATETYSD